MLLLNCPNCGPRNVAEFRFGGEVNARPKDPAALPEAEWASYLYLRANVSGAHTEWWYHRAGCGLWFMAERHTYSNQVLRTYVWQPSTARAPEAAAPPADLPSGHDPGESPEGTEPSAEG